eukprot:CAMPEP_0118818610 /NCGR_PEP_ID=MMETSP1162-20130426/6304_1 /TAXON_ID=33656 /ORGANISM="Phaeocystis Sp, Strain CCMP2710" /LENGTH=47 /DNA_ID= /DNA_START= /DNA_END= /DNA_ORIENTATION=
MTKSLLLTKALKYFLSLVSRSLLLPVSMGTSSASPSASWLGLGLGLG